MLRFDLGLSLPFTPDAPVPVSSYAHARGVTLLEMMMSLVILAGVVGGVVAMVDRATEDTKAAVTALHLRTVGDAANNYIKKNYAAIRAAADDPTNAGKSILIRISDMIADGHLSSGYAAKNPRGQDTCALVVKVGGKLASIVVTEGGDTIDNLTLGQIAATIGGAGGEIYSDAATTVRGAMGGWSVGTATFPAANHLGMACDGVTAGTVTLAAGHPAMALWLNEANEMTGLLHRETMGDGTLNTMNTPIRMGGAAVKAIGNTCAGNVAGGTPDAADTALQGSIAVDNTGYVLSCQAGLWKKAMGGGGETYTSPLTPLSIASTFGPYNHGLSGIPDVIQAQLVCQEAEMGYSPGDIIDLGGLEGEMNNNSNVYGLSALWANASQVGLSLFNNNYLFVPTRNAVGRDIPTASKWAIRIVASKFGGGGGGGGTDNGYWGDPVATFAALPTCDSDEDKRTRIVMSPAVGTGPRAYTCASGTGWAPLSIDDDGNMTVPMDITAGGGISASDGTAAVGYVALTEDGAVENTSCDIGGDGSVAEDIGTISRNTTGVILSCQDDGVGGATWKKATGSGGSGIEWEPTYNMPVNSAICPSGLSASALLVASVSGGVPKINGTSAWNVLTSPWNGYTIYWIRPNGTVVGSCEIYCSQSSYAASFNTSGAVGNLAPSGEYFCYGPDLTPGTFMYVK